MQLRRVVTERKKPCGPTVDPGGRSSILLGTGDVCVELCACEWFYCHKDYNSAKIISVSYLAFLLLCESIVFVFVL
jgi:hypothetical protein